MAIPSSRELAKAKQAIQRPRCACGTQFTGHRTLQRCTAWSISRHITIQYVDAPTQRCCMGATINSTLWQVDWERQWTSFKWRDARGRELLGWAYTRKCIQWRKMPFHSQGRFGQVITYIEFDPVHKRRWNNANQNLPRQYCCFRGNDVPHLALKWPQIYALHVSAAAVVLLNCASKAVCKECDLPLPSMRSF